MREEGNLIRKQVREKGEEKGRYRRIGEVGD